MKKLKYIIGVFVLSSLFSCNSKDSFNRDTVGKSVKIDSVISTLKTKPVADIYYEHGNFINTKKFPPIVTASKVLKHQNDWLLIDIRRYDEYEKGHIRGAFNVQKYRLIDYLTQTRNADAYDKVVIIDKDGQLGSYVTGILRYAGFDNVYVMYYGMAAWNSKFSEPLKKGYQKGFSEYIDTSDSKEEKNVVEEEEHTNNHKSIDQLIKEVPQLSDSLPSTYIEQRAKKLLKREPQNYLVKAETFFNEYKAHPNQYLPIFYMDNKKKFEESHIKGAVLYRSRKDLSLDSKLTALPKNKDLVLYCKTGHTSAAAAAYLNMLGYKSYSLDFGFNSFEGDNKVVDDYINDFPVVSGKDPFGQTKKKK